MEGAAATMDEECHDRPGTSKSNVMTHQKQVVCNQSIAVLTVVRAPRAHRAELEGPHPQCDLARGPHAHTHMPVLHGIPLLDKVDACVELVVYDQTPPPQRRATKQGLAKVLGICLHVPLLQLVMDARTPVT
ncbi:hypothetical protein B0T17DRAFT_503939 [Bombardia bombarda]|uniref:Uncharacterized protein n=1 Tax=Bombardia bombarda TaxID=252184 RepID=A0AA39XLZ7_9PEZI|nr:hypothetical protein B0T17DRAFT_503939 [Bombardia bombarda]